MPEQHHQEDQIVRSLSGDPQPPVESRDRVEAAVMAEIARPTRHVAPRVGLRLAAAVSAVAVLAVVLVAQPFSQSSASAALEEIAKVVLIEDPTTVPDSAFTYTRSVAQSVITADVDGLGVPYDKSHFVYQLTYDREIWIGTDGTTQLRLTARDPMFLGEEDEAIYYSSLLVEIDQLGVTNTWVQEMEYEVWPEDADALEELISQRIRGSQWEVPDDVLYVDEVLDILRESHISPQTRAAALAVLGDVDSLEFDDTVSGVSAFWMEYYEGGSETEQLLTFQIDPAGHLVFEERLQITEERSGLIPAGTVTWTISYEPPLVVDSLLEP